MWFWGDKYYCGLTSSLFFLFTAQYTITITSLSLTDNAEFTLNCKTERSPPTTITWTKDGQPIPEGIMSQMVTDTSTASYDNLLTLSGEPDSLTGVYQCAVQNSISDQQQTSVAFTGTYMYE